MRLVLVLALVLPSAAVSVGQETSVRPGINEQFQKPDVRQFVERFEREGREVYELRQQIIERCGLKPGMTVADIGAGTGLFTRLMAQQVESQGKVYAVDIAKEFVDHVVESCKEQELNNVVGVVCPPDSVNLPDQSIDVAFVCDTYHHFEFPHKSMTSLRRALRPGGRVIVIDFERIEGVSSEFILGHVRAGKEVFQKEIEEAGFELVQEFDLLKENYMLSFRKRGDQ